MSKDSIPQTPTFQQNKKEESESKESKEKKSNSQISKFDNIISELLNTAVSMQNESKHVLQTAQKIQTQTLGLSHLIEKYDNTFLVWQHKFFNDIKKILGNTFYEKILNNFKKTLGSPRNFILEYLPQDFEKMFLTVFLKTVKEVDMKISKIEIVGIISKLSTYLRMIYRIKALKSERLLKKIQIDH